jgi:hypothetical protein
LTCTGHGLFEGSSEESGSVLPTSARLLADSLESAFQFRMPAAIKRSGQAGDQDCQRPHSETLGLEWKHDWTRYTQQARGRLERNRETGFSRTRLWNRLEYQRRRRERRIRLQMTNHLRRCMTGLLDMLESCSLLARISRAASPDESVDPGASARIQRCRPNLPWQDCRPSWGL